MSGVLHDSHPDSFPHFCKHVLEENYRLPKLIRRFYDGLIHLCQQESDHYASIKTFARLLGIHIDSHYSAKRVIFFFQTIDYITNRNILSFNMMLLSYEVERINVVYAFEKVFEEIKQKAPEKYTKIMHGMNRLSSFHEEHLESYNVELVFEYILDCYDHFMLPFQSSMNLESHHHHGHHHNHHNTHHNHENNLQNNLQKDPSNQLIDIHT